MEAPYAAADRDGRLQLSPRSLTGYLADGFTMEAHVAAGPKILTADDVLDLPDPEGGIGWEFVDGQVVPVMPASFTHGEMMVEVAARLWSYVREHGLPGKVVTDVGVVLGLRRDPERMRGPDVLYIERAKLEGCDRERFLRVVPDLAIEIDLTSAKKPGGQQRIIDYLEAGVRLVWAIDIHSHTAMVYRPDGSARLMRANEALDGEDVVPGFKLPLAELFQ
jgi:Uma2 family endonuclease